MREFLLTGPVWALLAVVIGSALIMFLFGASVAASVWKQAVLRAMNYAPEKLPYATWKFVKDTVAFFAEDRIQARKELSDVQMELIRVRAVGMSTVEIMLGLCTHMLEEAQRGKYTDMAPVRADLMARVVAHLSQLPFRGEHKIPTVEQMARLMTRRQVVEYSRWPLGGTRPPWVEELLHEAALIALRERFGAETEKEPKPASDTSGNPPEFEDNI